MAEAVVKKLGWRQKIEDTLKRSASHHVGAPGQAYLEGAANVDPHVDSIDLVH